MTPRTFTDNKNRPWTVAVVYSSICTVSAVTGIDLRQLVEAHDAVSTELDNPARQKSVLNVLLADQLTKANVTIDDVFNEIVNEEQATEMVMAIYYATFDFFQAQGGTMADALGKVQRALKTAKKTAASRMKNSIDNGQMDRFLAIILDPAEVTQYVAAAQNTANAALNAAWASVETIEEPGLRLQAFVRAVVEQDLQLPAPPAAAATGAAPQVPTIQPSAKFVAPTSTANAGGSPASSGSTPAPSVGGSSS